MTWTVVVLDAVAAPWAGIVSPSRDDAPTDGVVLFVDIGYASATATDGQGTETTLDVDRDLDEWDVGVSGFLPPLGGWVSDESYTITVYGIVQSYAPNDPYGTFRFGTSSSPSPPPHEVVVLDTRLGSWSEPESWPGGLCCWRKRFVEFDVEAPDADPWAWTGLVNLPDDETTSFSAYLDLAVGPGAATLVGAQWLDDGLDPCFGIAGVSAAGTPGTVERICIDEDSKGFDPDPSDESDAEQGNCGCNSGAPAPWWLLVTVLFARRARTPCS